MRLPGERTARRLTVRHTPSPLSFATASSRVHSRMTASLRRSSGTENTARIHLSSASANGRRLAEATQEPQHASGAIAFRHLHEERDVALDGGEESQRGPVPAR